MFATRLKILASPGKFLEGLVRSKPGIVGAVLFLALAVWAGVSLWAQQRLAAADEFLRKCVYARAQEQIDKCLSVWPNDYRANLLAARICRARSKFLEAEKHLVICLRSQGKNEDLDLEWILLRAQNGHFLEFEYQLGKHLADGHAQSAQILETMTYCYMKDGRYRLALAVLNKWLDQQPSAFGFFMRATAAHKLGAGQDAQTDYRRALELDPDLWQARLMLVQLLFFEGSFDEGRGHLGILEQTHSDSPDVMFFRGLEHFQKGDLARAEECLDSALREMPNNYLVLYERGRLALQKGRYAEAESWLRKSLRAEPEWSAALFALRESLRLQHWRDEAIQAEVDQFKEKQQKGKRRQNLLEKLDKAPNDPEILVELGATYLENKELARARQYLLRAMQIQPNHQKGRNLLAATHAEAGE